ncbi:hypothetical protein BU23DRAFT_39358 [Bimuria novae-zelandiae CBS 107.79]|uniref:Uncharacterized protein n=1 Tax=Bimuria novae-zelandiae CBS 107.79 TaxID=1447943 RepID=A0A6A5UJ55_9PLEO|nr:hypothetical protein BU23DRAFT_39358 [Bimuria novae-zelandiae CBS 107.79]
MCRGAEYALALYSRRYGPPSGGIIKGLLKIRGGGGGGGGDPSCMDSGKYSISRLLQALNVRRWKLLMRWTSFSSEHQGSGGCADSLVLQGVFTSKANPHNYLSIAKGLFFCSTGVAVSLASFVPSLGAIFFYKGGGDPLLFIGRHLPNFVS